METKNQEENSGNNREGTFKFAERNWRWGWAQIRPNVWWNKKPGNSS